MLILQSRTQSTHQKNFLLDFPGLPNDMYVCFAHRYWSLRLRDDEIGTGYVTDIEYGGEDYVEPGISSVGNNKTAD